LNGNGSVELKITRKDNRVLLEIIDDGHGIAKELLPRLGLRGETYGKAGGSGLGLYHARSFTLQSGGTLQIQSQIGEGTRISITLPMSDTPLWFTRHIDLSEISRVVIVDDDISVHDIWSERLAGFKLQINHFQNPADFANWHKTGIHDLETLYLIDLQFSGSEMTGINLVKQLALAKNSILVTNQYDRADIISDAVTVGVGLLPKPLIPNVKISPPERG
jgi:hypothetical protein